LNNLLKLNKNLLLLILLIITVIFFFIIIFQNFSKVDTSIVERKINKNYDITNPIFTIKNSDGKISVKAKKGNFLSEDEILLEENVVFKSPKFELTSSSVIFNHKNQTATSEYESKFNTNDTIIVSEGFEITDDGNIIFFNGKTSLIMKNNIRNE
tara:strand:+ start:73 stop:537 length:465 start_codon:yes stop_codon:yes gene_type:complete